MSGHWGQVRCQYYTDTETTQQSPAKKMSSSVSTKHLTPERITTHQMIVGVTTRLGLNISSTS